MKINTASKLILAAAIVGGVSSRRVLQEVPGVGIDPTSPPTSDTSQADPTTTTTAEGDLIAALEFDAHITVVSPIEMGELMCDSLILAEDADALSFAITNSEVIVAEKSSFTVISGEAFTDNIGRKVWTGVVTDPGQGQDEAVPRTVSMTWGDVCSTETFLLQVIKVSVDETTTIDKTVPCFGSTTHTCLVQVTVEFDGPASALVPPGGVSVVAASTESESDERSTGFDSDTADSGSPDRRLQPGIIVVEVMVLYTSESLLALGDISAEQMETYIIEATARTNEAFANSNVALFFKAVHIGLLPFAQTWTTTSDSLLDITGNAAIGMLRDDMGADLVQVVHDFDDGFCGRAWQFNGSPIYGFSVVEATCLADSTVANAYGHNLGCFRNWGDSDFDNEYAHGFRYCSGVDPYRTIMSTTCGSPFVNYFSNPDVIVLDKPTGTATDDNARAIEDNMVAISNYRVSVPATTPVSTTPPNIVPPATAPPVVPPTPIAPPATAPPTVPPTAARAPPIVPPATTAPTTSLPITAPATSPPIAAPLTTPPITAPPTTPPITAPVTTPPITAPPTTPPITAPVTTPLITAPPTTPPITAPLTTPPITAPPTTPPITAPLTTPPITAPPTTPPITAPLTTPPITAPPTPPPITAPLTTPPITAPPTTPPITAPLTTPPITAPPTTPPITAPLTTPPITAPPTTPPITAPLTTPPIAPPTTPPPTTAPATPPATASPPTTPPITAPPTAYTLEGCYRDDIGNRTLSGEFIKGSETMTTEVCAAFCEGSPYFGTELGQECFCGVVSDDPGKLGNATCDFECTGDFSQMCGGLFAISVYTFDTDVSPPTLGFLGCWADPISNRIMAVVESNSTMTTEICVEICSAYPFYGTQWGKECWCGDESTDFMKNGPSDACVSVCAGDNTQTCGGLEAMSVYQHETTGAPPLPPPAPLGCWSDTVDGRIMEWAASNQTMTNDVCAEICSSYIFFGTQFAQECWCGDADTDHSIHGLSASCNMTCAGDAGTICGGSFAMTVWQYQ